MAWSLPFARAGFSAHPRQQLGAKLYHAFSRQKIQSESPFCEAPLTLPIV
jgi:hypothetical protein